MGGSGCGGGGSSMMSPNNTLSAAQAQAVSQQVVQAVTAALGSASGSLPAAEARPSLSTAVANVHRETSTGSCTTNANGQTCNIPLSYTGPCTDGGTISVSGDVSGTLDNSGDGSFTTQITITPANCAVSGTTFNGDPNITVGGQIGFTADNITYPLTFTEGGGISYGPNPSGSCQVNVTYSINAQLTCTVTGTVCGQSVNGSC